MRPLVNSSGLFLFIGVRPPPFPKKPDETEKLYYYFQISASKYTLFDSELNTAIACGSLVIIRNYIIKLPTDAVVFYYKLDTIHGWKKIESAIDRPNIPSKLVSVASTRPTTYPKKLEAVHTICHYFKIDSGEHTLYALFDSDMDTAIAYGCKLDVEMVIKTKLPLSTIILYYELDSNDSWKWKRTTKPNMQMEESKTIRDRITEKKKETVEEKTEKKKA